MTPPGRTFAVVGLGQHGSAVARLLAAEKYRLVGAVEIGDKVGKPVSEYVSGAPAEARIYGSIEELLTAAVPDIVVHAAPVEVQETAMQAAALMRAGVNVITLQPDMIAPEQSWADELNRIGRETGASFLATGVPDTWWLHLPRILAGASCSVAAVQIFAYVDANDLPAPIGRIVGIGMTGAEFAQHAELMKSGPSIMGTPLDALAKAMELKPLEVSVRLDPVIAEQTLRWTSGGADIRAGLVVGTNEVISFETSEGIFFQGTHRTALLSPGSKLPDRILIRGTPDLNVVIDPFPGIGITNASVVNRVADVIAAPGGVLVAAGLPPMRYRPALAS